MGYPHEAGLMDEEPTYRVGTRAHRDRRLAKNATGTGLACLLQIGQTKRTPQAYGVLLAPSS
jgi:hypothetical protein